MFATSIIIIVINKRCANALFSNMSTLHPKSYSTIRCSKMLIFRGHIETRLHIFLLRREVASIEHYKVQISFISTIPTYIPT